MPDPTVSVVIAAHDCEAYIERALSSVLAQTLSDLEVIVVDDGSSDGTASRATAIAASDGRVRVIELGRNDGPSAARNRGLAEARGRWIALLDADDYYLPKRLAELVATGEQSAADMVSDNIRLVREEDGSDLGSMFTADAPPPREISASEFILGNMPDPTRPRASMGFLKPIFRADFLRRHGLTYDEGMRFGEDFRFYLESLLAGARWFTSPMANYVYSVRSASLTGRHGVAELTLFCAAEQNLLAHPRVAADPELRTVLARHLVTSQQRLYLAAFSRAVKRGDIGGAMRAGLFSYPVFRYILSHCVRLAVVRSARALPLGGPEVKREKQWKRL